MTPALQTAPSAGVPAGLRRKAYDDVTGASEHAAGVIHVAPDGAILLCLRSPTEKNYGGHWSLPGGKAEEGESPEEAALREVGEELGDDVDGGPMKLVDRRMTPTGMAFSTFARPVQSKFQPRINEEHVGYGWFPLDRLPDNLHPGVAATLKDRVGVGGEDMSPEDWSGLRDGFVRWTLEEEAEAEHAEDVATDSVLVLALDRDSVRTFDQDGRLRVAKANLSKANVCPYRGSEIPRWEELGLDPDKIYQLLRDPEELRKAVETANGVPILRKHVAVSADDHQPHEVVGSTGTEAEFDGTYLTNSLVIWAREAIDGIESGGRRELSMGYHYDADMTPGKFGGMDFDGVMRNIRVNHEALVEDGRVGPDVVVGDSNEEIQAMDNAALAKRINAVAHRQITVGALVAYLRPRLAMDARAKPLGVAKVLAGVTGKNFREQRSVIAKRIRELAGPKLAKDADLDDVEKVLDMLDKHEIDGVADESVSEAQHNAMEAAAHGQSDLDIPKRVGKEFVEKDKGKTFDAEPIKAFLREKGMSEDDIGAVSGMFPKPATDEFPDKKDGEETEEEKKKREAAEAAKDNKMVTKDELSSTLKAALAAQAANEQDIRLALDEVRPYVGNLPATIGFDSGAKVRRHALTTLGVKDVDKIHESALKTILEMQPKPGARPAERERPIGMDAGAVSDFNSRFPDAARITQV